MWGCVACFFAYARRRFLSQNLEKIPSYACLNSSIGKNCTSFENLKISETLPIIKNCDLYLGNDTGWLHIAAALKIKCLALFMDSPVQAYGKYSNFINVIVPEGETEETTTHDTLGSEKISFEKVLNSSIELLKKNQS